MRLNHALPGNFNIAYLYSIQLTLYLSISHAIMYNLYSIKWKRTIQFVAPETLTHGNPVSLRAMSQATAVDLNA